MTNELQIVRNDYNKLSNLPKINGIELKGNKTSEDLGIGGESNKDIVLKTGIGETTITDTDDVALLNELATKLEANPLDIPSRVIMPYGQQHIALNVSMAAGTSGIGVIYAGTVMAQQSGGGFSPTPMALIITNEQSSWAIIYAE